MTYLKTILIFFLLPFDVFAQDLTGVWTGFLQVDDNKIPYELVISGEKNNLNGYSLMTFTFNGVENVGVKTMEIKVKRSSIALVDGDLIYDNYNTPPRHVKLYADLAWVGKDTSMTLAGTFATRSLDMRMALHENAFKGIVHLEKRNPHAQTKLTQKLNEMDLLTQLSFKQPVPNKEGQNGAMVMAAKETKSSKTKAKETTANDNIAPSKEDKSKNALQSHAAVPKLIPAADVSKRGTGIIQTVAFKSDTLKLSLYDNGEVDGDTITVVLNGETIMPQVGLTAKGVSMTISTSSLLDSSRLVMYAENLGRIPPNTGLLILQDGDDRYQIRFSGDLQKNSAIILRRKH